MHPRTEDLLSVRDGEPIDAATRARLLEDPAAMAEVERLRSVRHALHELPELDPPPHMWLAIAARTGAQGSPPRRPIARLLVGAAIAATVAVAALLSLSGLPGLGGGDAPPAQIVGSDPSTSPLRPPLAQPSYASLIEESARLEQVLTRLPQRRVTRVGTASTIVGLEDRITFIDEQLTIGAARGLPPEQRQALWRERVDLLNALVHVRYAQSEYAGF